MFQDIASLQQEIYLSFGSRIQAFANGGGWTPLFAFIPMGIVFGAVHAMTPGHSKTILATYLAGSPSGLARGIAVSLALSFTHVSMSVLIALLSLPLISITLGSVGRAPMLEDISRGLLGVIGMWVLFRAFRRSAHCHDRSEAMTVGVFAGLVPCPLTLFVMTFATSRGVPEAGIAFAVVMMIGVAFTLSTVGVATVFFRKRVTHLIEYKPVLLDVITRGVEGLAGVILIAIAIRELVWR